jgi:hypothetical protein
MSLFNHATPLNCGVDASSSDGDAYGPDRVIDGSDFTSWCSKPCDYAAVTEWIQLDFKRPISIEIVRIIWGESLQVYATFTVCFTFVPSNILTNLYVLLQLHRNSVPAVHLPYLRLLFMNYSMGCIHGVVCTLRIHISAVNSIEAVTRTQTRIHTGWTGGRLQL